MSGQAIKIRSQAAAANEGASARDARREAILDVARDVFLDEGYAAASMSTIAARLGGSKGTLYNYFRSKDELFAAYVRRHCDTLQERMFALLVQGDTRQALLRLGRSYLEIVLSDEIQAHFRMIVAEAKRNPMVARIFYESGPLVGTQRLADFLAEEMAAGRLKQADPLRAAHHFFALCQNWWTKARLCNYLPEPSAAEIEEEVEAAVDIFLAAYGAS
ncbi:MAG: TetR/AcrR family transcriptional regulator [Hyphomonadaceae bacterium]